MIRIMDLCQKHNWLSDIESNLHKYSSILHMEPVHIISQILRGELAVFNVNDDLIALARKSLLGNEVIFYVVFSFSIKGTGFFHYRSILKQHFKEVAVYVRDTLGCDRLELMCGSKAHVDMYKTVLSKSSPKVFVQHYVQVFL